MTKDQVQIGGVYTAKVTDKVTPVRIDREHPSGGWIGTNLATDRQVRIKSPRKLRSRVRVPDDDALKTNTKPNANVTPRVAKAKVKASTPKASAKSAPRGQRSPRKANVPGKLPGGQLSCLDAAAKVLGESKPPMHCKEMIEAMAARGYWTTPGGKTPHATLYSAISREIAMKGDDSRFRKAERGRFTLVRAGAGGSRS